MFQQKQTEESNIADTVSSSEKKLMNENMQKNLTWNNIHSKNNELRWSGKSTFKQVYLV